MAVDEPQPFSLAEYMADKPALWEAMGRKYHLAPHALNELVQWPFGDFIFRVVYDAFLDVNKLRRLGFHEMQVPQLRLLRAGLRRAEGPAHHPGLSRRPVLSDNLGLG